METWREIREKFEGENQPAPTYTFQPIIWNKLEEMEDRIEKLEKRSAPTPYSERRM